MREYEIKYEAPPISEITKVTVIEADRIDLALKVFVFATENVSEIFSITLIDSIAD